MRIHYTELQVDLISLADTEIREYRDLLKARICEYIIQILQVDLISLADTEIREYRDLLKARICE